MDMTDDRNGKGAGGDEDNDWLEEETMPELPEVTAAQHPPQEEAAVRAAAQPAPKEELRVEAPAEAAEAAKEEPPAEREKPAATPEMAVLEKKQEDNIRSVIEALLFASDKPLTVEQIKKVLDNLDAGQVKRSLEKLKAEYEDGNRGMRLTEVAGGFKMISAPMFASFLRKLFKGPQNTEKLSGPAMETLAIIAYKQPLSKMEIETLRKVNADGVMGTLLEKALIRVTGRRDAPGRPKVYGTTREFLEYFGLKSLEDLPKLENFPLPPDKEKEIMAKAQGEASPGVSNKAGGQEGQTDGPKEAAKTD